MGWNQTDLAEIMAQQGYAWYQATVSSVENGLRDLRNHEIVSLAELFDIHIVVYVTKLPDHPPEQDLDGEFWRLVRPHREAMKWTQSVLAERMFELGYRWYKSTVSDVERGKRELGNHEIVSLADLFGIDIVVEVRRLPDLDLWNR